jgi:hypothetical protein
MNNATTKRLAGLLLISVPIVFTGCFFALQVLFEYPDILRQPAAEVLRKFQQGGPMLIAVWYTLTLTALLFIPTVVALHQALAPHMPPAFLGLATAFGVTAGLVQALGFVRWPFVVPYLAEAYLAPGAGEPERAAILVVFEALHRYAGMGIGENLGYTATSLWTLLLGAALLRMRLLGRWLPLVGIALALGIATGVLELFGWEAAGPINAISYLLWALWLVVLGVMLLVRREVPLAKTLAASA